MKNKSIGKVGKLLVALLVISALLPIVHAIDDTENFGISLPIDHTAADNNGSGFIILDSNSFYAIIAGLAVFFPILGLLVYREKRR